MIWSIFSYAVWPSVYVSGEVGVQTGTQLRVCSTLLAQSWCSTNTSLGIMLKKKNQKPKPKPNQTKGNESCSKTHLLTPMPFFWQFPTLRSHCTCHVLSGQFGFPTDSSALCRLQAPTTFFCSISLSHALYLTMEDSLLSYLSLSCKLFEGKD